MQPTNSVGCIFEKLGGTMFNKVAIVTGASSGLGYQVARLLAERGVSVVAVGRSAEKLDVFAEFKNVVCVTADVTISEDVDRIVSEAENRFGRLDILCNIAGMNDLSYPLEEVDDERWDRVMDVDLKAPFRICRRAIRTMIKSGGGSIVNVGSYAALRGNHGPTYTAAKAGLNGLTKSIAFYYAKDNILCNVVNPGGMATNIGETSGGKYHADGQKGLSDLCRAMPVNVYADPVLVAKTIVFLCGDDSVHINGADISVDGGMSCC